ncbi:hypothetical protein GALMADRAFT_221455 [Galerina marginata CBS 339.88]|uniref:Ribosomal protein S21 n=1 Tax=Galerina marginata (strain CBS 339.88) TaxID=685588 RepID=A0A067TGW5_GALM3|nr:hypothetical protein GALMADRAFT_221455 [Galerina marginata CBS 339.88]
MQRLARLLSSSALRVSHLGLCISRARTNFYIPTTFATFPALHRNVRLLSSTTYSEHPVSEALEKKFKAAQTPEDRWREKSRRALEDAKNHGPANAYTGRCVVNASEKHLAASFRKLEAILSRNKVRQHLRLSERHEKKGVKRRRLSSERWRKRFANEVRKKVQLVIKIRDRGA